LGRETALASVQPDALPALFSGGATSSAKVRLLVFVIVVVVVVVVVIVIVVIVVVVIVDDDDVVVVVVVVHDDDDDVVNFDVYTLIETQSARSNQRHTSSVRLCFPNIFWFSIHFSQQQ
jgi:hypothetical protein